MKRTIILIFLALMLTGCEARNNFPEASENSHEQIESSEIEKLPPEEEISKPVSKAEKTLAGMDLREKVGQLFIIRPDALDFTLPQEIVDEINTEGVTEVTEATEESFKTYPAGGIVMFGKNLLSPQQVTSFNQKLQSISDVPLFICIDEEGGSVARLANNPGFQLPQYKSAADVGKSKNPEDAFKMGDTIGGYLSSFGFNVDFAPIADVNTNPNNPVIGLRAFSDDPNEAAILSGAMAEGLRHNKVMPVFKHFPGHGDTDEDSHIGIAAANKTKAEMENCEWLPFQKAQKNDGIMAGHIAVPKITGDLTPSTMSPEIITGILRKELEFEGLIITDSLSMGAVTNNYTPSDAAITAFKAGCDILLMPHNYREAFDGIIESVESGTITTDELDKKVLHILEIKEANGIL